MWLRALTSPCPSQWRRRPDLSTLPARAREAGSRRGGRVAEGTRLLSEYGEKSPSGVRIPSSPFWDWWPGAGLCRPPRAATTPAEAKVWLAGAVQPPGNATTDVHAEVWRAGAVVPGRGAVQPPGNATTTHRAEVCRAGAVVPGRGAVQPPGNATTTHRAEVWRFGAVQPPGAATTPAAAEVCRAGAVEPPGNATADVRAEVWRAGAVQPPGNATTADRAEVWRAGAVRRSGKAWAVQPGQRSGGSSCACRSIPTWTASSSRPRRAISWMPVGRPLRGPSPDGSATPG